MRIHLVAGPQMEERELFPQLEVVVCRQRRAMHADSRHPRNLLQLLQRLAEVEEGGMLITFAMRQVLVVVAYFVPQLADLHDFFGVAENVVFPKEIRGTNILIGLQLRHFQ